MNLDLARRVADAVLYEGYLLYPYRASADKNRVRWQFGVLGPPGATDAGIGEPTSMSMQTVFTDLDPPARLVVHLRFLHLQRRQVYDAHGDPVDELCTGDDAWTSWDEAVEEELVFSFDLPPGDSTAQRAVTVAGGQDEEPLAPTGAGRLVRRRARLDGRLQVRVQHLGSCARLTVAVHNLTASPATSREAATRDSFLGAHLLLEAHGAGFVSLTDPPAEAAEATAGCSQDRCWPVLAGEPGDTDLLLGSPIILYDYPEIAAQSPTALFDATEIDEILSLRVMTMTEQEKAEARRTDARAREIIDRCDALSAEQLQKLHGAFREPRSAAVVAPPGTGAGEPAPWWDPSAEGEVRPETDTVTVAGVPVSNGSLVRVHPRRRADAQDMFFADQVARVTGVLSDVDGGVHVALVLADDEAADLHDWYGRYWYFTPDELEPLVEEPAPTRPSESHPRGEENRP